MLEVRIRAEQQEIEGATEVVMKEVASEVAIGIGEISGEVDIAVALVETEEIIVEEGIAAAAGDKYDIYLERVYSKPER